MVPRKLGFGHGVKWREYEDGVVVYVAATCETHILEPQFAAFFRLVASQASKPGAGNNELPESPSEFRDPLITGSFLQELVSLKILDPGN